MNSPPRPVPMIKDELTFSRKKKSNRFHENSFTPRSPIKSAPPISRIFRNRKPSTPGAHAVSFRQSQIKGDVNIQSPLYKTFDQLFFDQCFTKLTRLGTGSFGEVWKVQSKEDGKLYAVKKSRERFRGDFDRKQRLEEVNKNEFIPRHKNCVHFFKAWEELDHLYIQTELCEMSLKDYAESVQFIEEKEIWNMIVDLCNGLKNLHDADFVHMDLKSANMFLGRDGFYKIGDFGLVVELTRDLSNVMDGDAKYLAPEIMEGHFSKAADIFSLGITILELACSLELPKGGVLWHTLREGKLPIEFTEGLSDDLIVFITRAMDPNYLTRPSINEIVKMCSVVRAQKMRHNIGYMSSIFRPILYLITLISLMLSYVLNIFNRQEKKKFRPQSITPPPFPESLLAGPVGNAFRGHESLVQNATPEDINAYQRDNSSPFPQPSPFFQPVSNKRETNLWNYSPTDLNFCSSPRLSDCSPSTSPMSDRLVRSRLFTCISSDDEEDVCEFPKVPKNLFDDFSDE